MQKREKFRKIGRESERNRQRQSDSNSNVIRFGAPQPFTDEISFKKLKLAN